MLEHINLHRAEMKDEFKAKTKALKAELAVLQQTIKEKKLPILIVMEGWGASGKGSMISEMISTLDPRSFKVYSTSDIDCSEMRRPFLWRYWNKVPEYGRISIFDRSWYQECSVRRVEDSLSPEEAYSRMDSINLFERQLTDDGALIVKFFLHISQKEQKNRLEHLEKDKHTAWRVTAKDKKRNRHYEDYYQAFDEMCTRTSTPYAPWYVIGCHNKGAARYEMFRILVEAIHRALDGERQESPRNGVTVPPPKPCFTLLTMPKLSEVGLDRQLTEEEYDQELKKQQKILFKLQNKLYQTKTPVVIAFEGWDAAGKGGAIKRVTAALDPRGYEAIPVAAPNAAELAHHYLWRFWKSVPKTGHIAIFDRSWYGRVMVERVEGFTKPERWQQAYQEMNEFEYELTKQGGIVMKFWLQIDKEEQLARFTERQKTPEKQWKITDEDWRNREKWNAYETAVDEMIQRTSTDFAPWTIVEAKDKKFARIKVLKTINDLLKERLDGSMK